MSHPAPVISRRARGAWRDLWVRINTVFTHLPAWNRHQDLRRAWWHVQHRRRAYNRDSGLEPALRAWSNRWRPWFRWVS